MIAAAGVAALALPLLRSTQGAAVACLPWVGRDDPKAADGAAVDALRRGLGRLPGQCRVVIGEGEKDDAPMLYRGEVLGTGAAPACDVAVDPLEGTRLCARGQDGAVSVIAAAPPESLLATPGWYMEKLVVGPAATGAVSLDRPVEDNLAALGRALGKPVRALVVGVQDRPRHHELVVEIRQAGAAVALPRRRRRLRVRGYRPHRRTAPVAPATGADRRTDLVVRLDARPSLPVRRRPLPPRCEGRRVGVTPT